MPHDLAPRGSSQDESNTSTHNAVLCEQRKSYQGDPKSRSSLTPLWILSGHCRDFPWVGKDPLLPQRLGGQLLTACLQLHGLILWHCYFVTSCGFNKDTGRDLPSLHNGVQVRLQRVKKPQAMETPGCTKAGEKHNVKALIGKTRSAGF